MLLQLQQQQQPMRSLLATQAGCETQSSAKLASGDSVVSLVPWLGAGYCV